MIVQDKTHDIGSKRLLRRVTLPEATSGDADIRAGLDALYQHPNVAPFISYRLIQRFVKSNPSRGYVRKVAKAFEGSADSERGNFKNVMKAILLDDAAFHSLSVKILENPSRVRVSTTWSTRTSVVEPVLFFTRFMRQYLEQTSGEDGTSRFPPVYITKSHATGPQIPYESPTVFNFYSPDHQPSGYIADTVAPRWTTGGKFVSPELELYTPGVLNSMSNRYLSFIEDEKLVFNVSTMKEIRERDFQRVECRLDFQREKDLTSNLPALLEHLNITLCHGSMPEKFERSLRKAIEEFIPDSTDDSAPKFERTSLRLRAALHSILMSPYCLVTE